MATAVATSASAQGAPNRDGGWDTATNVLSVSSLAVETLLPRVFYSDPDVTVGWKARWHLSVLAPTMTLVTLALANETSFKSAFGGARPGCDGFEGQTGCTSFGFMSTPSFVVDTLKWNHGQINVGGLLGQVAVPLIIAPIVAAGRVSGNWEDGGQSWGSAGVGLLAGFGLGVVYALLQRPECGYTGSIVCW